MLAEEEGVIKDKIELSVLYFNSKDFRKALTLYDGLVSRLMSLPLSRVKAIRKEIYGLAEEAVVGPTVHPRLGSVLDQRAATYEKLGDFPQALKDAEMLTKYDPLSCKGYLRRGKILTKLHKELEAYRVYQKGRYIIERAIETHGIQVPDKLYSNLKAQHSNMNSYLKGREKKKSKGKAETTGADHQNSSLSLSNKYGLDKQIESMLSSTLSSRSKATSSSISQSSATNKKRKRQLDPVKSLPIDIVHEIFANLPMTCILNCHLVSKDWYSTLTSIASLYTRGVYCRQKLTLPQFLGGMKLVKRSVRHSYSKSIKHMKLRSTISTSHLSRMLDYILTEMNLSIEWFEVINKDFSLELLVKRLDNCKWNTSFLSKLKKLRIGLNSSLKLDIALLNIMEKLKSLEIVILDNQMSSSNNILLPKNDKVKKILETRKEEYVTLESLNVVNHPKLSREFLPTVSMNNDTYDSHPKFLELKFPNLVSLTIVSYDFSKSIATFQRFLTDSPKLKNLYLENNDNLSIQQFCELLELSHSDCKLKKLTLREKRLQREVNMNQFSIYHMPQLNSLRHLDIYASSLSVRGLLKMLEICNMENNLNYLGMGNSNYVFFKNDKINTRIQRIGLNEIFDLAPNLKVLCLNEIELDNSSMKFFHKDIMHKINSRKFSLKVLDLSFCNHVDGIGLMNLFDAYDKFSDGKSAFRLDELVLHGLEINKSTLDLLQRREYVKVIRNDPFKVKWRQYGTNTLVPDV